ncbi:translation initiation factor IF-3 [Candidatus Dojkabacteria bacterium]|nr:translation initiation factor IF-3 [Candidatus Dojkabacteria bacterium]
MLKSIQLIFKFSQIARYKRRGGYKPRQPQIRVNRNHYIKADEVFVVDDSGEALGKMDTKKAVKLAQDKELDLIEISPKANPPVAKIMSFSKYKYELTKKKKDAKKNKAAEQKEMWFKAFIEEGDLNHKLKKVAEFLDKKHPVKIQIRPVGRTPKEQMIDLIQRILVKLEGKFEANDDRPKREGRNMSLILRPKKSNK